MATHQLIRHRRSKLRRRKIFSHKKSLQRRLVSSKQGERGERRGRREKRAATARPERIWDYAVIPYEIDSNFSGVHKVRQWASIGGSLKFLAQLQRLGSGGHRTSPCFELLMPLKNSFVSQMFTLISN